jgi:hypothetical protein
VLPLGLLAHRRGQAGVRGEGPRSGAAAAQRGAACHSALSFQALSLMRRWRSVARLRHPEPFPLELPALTPVPRARFGAGAVGARGAGGRADASGDLGQRRDPNAVRPPAGGLHCTRCAAAPSSTHPPREHRIHLGLWVWGAQGTPAPPTHTPARWALSRGRLTARSRHDMT